MMLALVTLMAGAASAAQIILDSGSNCPLDTPFSCSKSTPVDADTCCFESPGGLVVQTQFWDYFPAVGDDNLFTVHGLWPDFCNGDYESYCRKARQLSEDYDFDELFERFNDYDSLQFMKRNWLNLKNNGPDLWLHQWNKHGLCFNTLKEECYSKGTLEDQNVYEYYRKTLELFYRLPTYQWLVEAGIYPDAKKKYKVTDIEKALTKGFGFQPQVLCNKYGALQEVYYYHHVKGSVRDGEFARVDSVIFKKPKVKCPTSIYWYPKGWTPPK